VSLAAWGRFGRPTLYVAFTFVLAPGFNTNVDLSSVMLVIPFVADAVNSYVSTQVPVFVTVKVDVSPVVLVPQVRDPPSGVTVTA
jgi:hypothetical protein